MSQAEADFKEKLLVELGILGDKPYTLGGLTMPATYFIREFADDTDLADQWLELLMTGKISGTRKRRFIKREIEDIVFE